MSNPSQDVEKMEGCCDESQERKADVQQPPPASHVAQGDSSTDVNTERTGQDPKYSTDVLNLVTSQMSSGAIEALKTSWHSLNDEEQSAFVTSSVKYVLSCTVSVG